MWIGSKRPQLSLSGTGESVETDEETRVYNNNTGPVSDRETDSERERKDATGCSKE